jgi:hypothetical protein
MARAPGLLLLVPERPTLNSRQASSLLYGECPIGSGARSASDLADEGALELGERAELLEWR